MWNVCQQLENLTGCCIFIIASLTTQQCTCKTTSEFRRHVSMIIWLLVFVVWFNLNLWQSFRWAMLYVAVVTLSWTCFSWILFKHVVHALVTHIKTLCQEPLRKNIYVKNNLSHTAHCDWHYYYCLMLHFSLLMCSSSSCKMTWQTLYSRWLSTAEVLPSGSFFRVPWVTKSMFFFVFFFASASSLPLKITNPTSHIFRDIFHVLSIDFNFLGFKGEAKDSFHG